MVCKILVGSRSKTGMEGSSPAHFFKKSTELRNWLVLHKPRSLPHFTSSNLPCTHGLLSAKLSFEIFFSTSFFTTPTVRVVTHKTVGGTACGKIASFAGVQFGSYVSIKRSERAPDWDRCAEYKVLYAPFRESSPYSQTSLQSGHNLACARRAEHRWVTHSVCTLATRLRGSATSRTQALHDRQLGSVVTSLVNQSEQALHHVITNKWTLRTIRPLPLRRSHWFTFRHLCERSRSRVQRADEWTSECTLLKHTREETQSPH